MTQSPDRLALVHTGSSTNSLPASKHSHIWGPHHYQHANKLACDFDCFVSREEFHQPANDHITTKFLFFLTCAKRFVWLYPSAITCVYSTGSLFTVQLESEHSTTRACFTSCLPQTKHAYTYTYTRSDTHRHPTPSESLCSTDLELLQSYICKSTAWPPHCHSASNSTLKSIQCAEGNNVLSSFHLRLKSYRTKDHIILW